MLLVFLFVKYLKKDSTLRKYYQRCSLQAGSPFCMASEVSSERMRERTTEPRGTEEKESLQRSLTHFLFLLRPDEVKYHLLKNGALPINFDWWHSWLTHQNIFVTRKSGILLLYPRKNKQNIADLKGHVSAEFKEYCWSPKFIGYGPHLYRRFRQIIVF